jgi:hypothetical protein
MSWIFLNLPIYTFYIISGLIISGFIYVHKRKVFQSILIGMLLVFVSSEFWELPKFVMAYLGFYSWQPEILNHIIILFMAILLVSFSHFKLTFSNGTILLSDLVFNSLMFLVSFPFRDWILRSLTLFSLSYIFILEIWKIHYFHSDHW